MDEEVADPGALARRRERKKLAPAAAGRPVRAEHAPVREPDIDVSASGMNRAVPLTRRPRVVAAEPCRSVIARDVERAASDRERRSVVGGVRERRVERAYLALRYSVGMRRSKEPAFRRSRTRRASCRNLVATITSRIGALDRAVAAVAAHHVLPFVPSNAADAAVVLEAGEQRR